uniref:Uncharacterized protein n=1 Tax=Palpitomonas bilix TaxID=652834 RepID=A0A7S3DK83_9EUKA
MEYAHAPPLVGASSSPLFYHMHLKAGTVDNPGRRLPLMENYGDGIDEGVQVGEPTTEMETQTEEEVVSISLISSRKHLLSAPSSRCPPPGKALPSSSLPASTAREGEGEEGQSSGMLDADGYDSEEERKKPWPPLPLVPAIGKHGWVIDDPLVWQPRVGRRERLKRRKGRKTVHALRTSELGIHFDTTREVAGWMQMQLDMQKEETEGLKRENDRLKRRLAQIFLLIRGEKAPGVDDAGMPIDLDIDALEM